jgi:hypothetical protein
MAFFIALVNCDDAAGLDGDEAASLDDDEVAALDDCEPELELDTDEEY